MTTATDKLDGATWGDGMKKSSYSIRQLKLLCRRLVVELRDKETCQRCGSRRCDSQIQWAHVKAGRALTLFLKPWASLALCAGCHFWYDANGNGRVTTVSRKWWAEKFPDRDLLLRAWEHDRKRPKFDPLLEKLWLEQELKRLGA